MKSIWLFLLAVLTLLVDLHKITNNHVILLFVFFVIIWAVYRLNYKVIPLIVLYALIIYKLPIYGVNVNVFRHTEALLRHIPSSCRSYVSLFLFNNKSASSIYKNSQELGITFLVVVSGLHFNFLYNLLYKFLNHYFDEIVSNIVVFLFLFGYLFILNFSVSALRAFIMLLLGVFNKNLFKDYLNKLDIFFITLLIILFLNPTVITSYGFIFSFTLTFFIIVVSSFTRLNMIKLSLLSFACSLPILISINGKFNLLTPLYSLILTYPYLLAIIASLLLLPLPFLAYVFRWYFLLLDKLTYVLSKVSIIIHISYFNFFMCLIYYVTLLILLYWIERKCKDKIIEKGFALALIITLCFLKPYGESPYRVTFLNVYQGDSICFTSIYSRKAYLVDTGGIQNKDIATTILIPFLKSKNIKYVETVVITHNDYDHSGALVSLKNSFEIRRIMYKADALKIFKFSFQNINKNTYNNDNDNSIVLYGKYSKIKLLLTGDISSKVEKDLIVNYPTLKVDVLKVAHHGSKYSSSQEFLEAYKPKISIISYGYNNYGHPHGEVIKRLTDIHSNIYSTFEHGNITLQYKYNCVALYSSKRKKTVYIKV